MIILALVSVIQTGAIFRYRHRKKLMTLKIRCPMKLRKVDVIIVTQYFETLNQFPDTQ